MQFEDRITSLTLEFYRSLTDIFLSFFEFEQRFSILFILTALIAAFYVFKYENKQIIFKSSKSELLSFLQFLQLKDVFWHPSAKLDYMYWVVHALLLRWIVTPLYLLLFIPAIDAGYIISAYLNETFGTQNIIQVQNNSSIWIGMSYGVALFAMADFAHYWVHRLCHSVPFLWQYHKTHHSAEVLVPPTAVRIHPLEDIIEKIFNLIIIGITSGIFLYIFNDSLFYFVMMGANYAYFISDFAAANLRHSHVWLSFGSRIEHLFMSPAQHQIHHSTNPKHYNKNLATHLSLWDWIFGTLYTTTSKKEVLVFGLGEQENKNFRTLKGLLIHPFLASFKTLKISNKNTQDKHKNVI